MSQRILVPYDGSDSAGKALEFALTTFETSPITVLHVVEPFPDHTAAGVENYRTEWPERAEAHAEKLFERARAIGAEYDRELRTEWVYGRPRHEIVVYIEANDIGGVVMGSQGKGAASRLVFGSVAEAVVRRSPVTVTVVK